MVPEVGLEPTHTQGIPDFESSASAIPPLRHIFKENRQVNFVTSAHVQVK